MKMIYFLVLITLFKSVDAQHFSPELQSMVDAENAFAEYSKEKNTRDAFLIYLTDSTVMFDKNGPKKGKKSWVEGSPNENLLFWRPLFVGISKSGDLGFSTGPWEWSPTKEKAKPEAHGYYATVWQKFPDGWKMAVDIGISMASAELNPTQLHSSNPKGVLKESVPKNTMKRTFLTVDEDYNKKINAAELAFNKEDFCKDGLILRSGSFPDYHPFKNQSAAAHNFKFTPLGGDVATSNDLGYSFGRVQFKTKENDAVKMIDANFLRVWKVEDGAWKLVLDVIAVPD